MSRILITILNILEFSACITGFLYWKKIRHSYWRWFPVYLGIIVVTELVAEYFLYAKNDLTVNINIYRFFGVPFEFLFLFWLFYQYLNNTSKNKWPVFSAAIYLICLLIDLLYVGKMKLLFDSFSYTIGNILLLVLLLMFFLKFIKSDDILEYKSSMMFWVCLGLLIFYLGSLPFYGIRTTLYKEYRDFFFVYWYIQYGLNYLMYILFALSFIWGKPK
ncbi:MAG: hypothetical protein ABIN97_17410 [Ginsengibacter sp.]